MDASFGIGMLFRAKDMASGVVGGLEGRMKSLGGASDRASRKFAKSMDRMRAGLKLMAAGGAVVGGMGLLVKSTVASQQALGEMGSLGYKNFGALDKAATRFTNKWAGYSKAQFITAAYDIKSGIESLSDEGVAQYTRMAVLTAKATKASAGEMTKLFALIYGVYKSSYKNMSDLDFGRMVSGGISAAVKVFRTDGRDLVQGISSIGRAAQGMGVKFHEQLAILGVAKGAFGTAAEAGTGYRAFLTTVLKAQKGLGMSFTDSQGRLLPFVGILKKIEAKFGDLSKAKAQMALQKAFGSAEAVKFIMAFAGKTKYLTAKLSELKGAMKGGTAVTVEMARAMNMRIGDVLKLFGQRMHNMFESIGKTLLPVVIPIVNAIGKVITAVQKFAADNPRLVGTITRIVFAVGGLVFALGAGAVAWHFFGRYALIAMAGVAKTFLPVALAVGALVGIIYLVRKAWKSNFGGIATTLTNFWNKVKLVWEGVTTLIGSFTGKAGTMSSELADKLKKAGLFKFVVGVFRFFARARAFITGLFQGIWSAISPVFKQIWSGLQGIWRAISPVFQWIGKLFGGLGSLATGGTVKGIRGIGQAVGKFIVTPFKWAWSIFSKGLSVVQGVIKGLVKALKPVWSVIVNVFQSVKSSLKPLFDLFGKLWGWISRLFGGSGSDKASGWVRAGEIIGNVLGGIIRVVANVIGTVVKIIAWGIGAAVKIFNWLVDAGAWVWDQIEKGAQAVGSFFAGVWNTIKSTAASVWQAIENTVTGVLRGIVTVARRIFAGLLKIVLAPIKGVLWIASAFSSRAGRAYDRIKAWEASLTGQGKKAKATGGDTAKAGLGGGLTERPAVKRARQTVVQQAVFQHMGGDAPGIEGGGSSITNAVLSQVAAGQQTQQAGFSQLAAAVSQQAGAVAKMASRPVIVQVDGREIARVVAAEAGERVRRSLGL